MRALSMAPYMRFTKSAELPVEPTGGRRRPSPLWLWYVAGGAALAVAYLLTPSGAFHARVLKVVLYCTVSASAPIAMAVGIRWHRPKASLPWWLLVLSQSIYAAADATFYVRHDLLGWTTYPSVSDLLYLVRVLPLIVALVLLVRRRTPGRDLAALTDGAILGVGASVLAWIYLIGPQFHTEGESSLSKLTSMAFPTVDLLVLVMALRLLIGAGARTRSFNLLIAGFLVLLTADSIYGLQQLAGSYSAGNFVDVLWLSFYLLVGAGALHPSMRRLGEPSPVADQILGRHRLVALALASLTAPAALLLQHFRHAALDIPVLAGAAAVLFVLVLIRMAGLVAAQHQAAVTDGLTGLHNRRFFEAQLQLEGERSRRHNQPLAVLILDIDHFKTVNDSYGHHAGDRVLCQVAARLHDVIRPGDVLARHGGEEFALLLPGSSPVALRATADRLRDAIAGEPMRVNEDGWVAITVSVGGVLVPDHAATVDEAILVADRALYAAKDGGRDRVIVGSPPPREKADSALEHPTLAFLSRLAVDLDDQQSPMEHSAAVGRWAALLAREYGLSAPEVRLCEVGATLHDIGKIAFPTQILRKPGPLTDSEWQVLRTHPEQGARLVGLIPELEGVAEIIAQHHERFDGSGYPDGLAGSRICLGARLIALCDSYADMRVDRVDQAALSPEQAYAEIRRCRGTQFDPDLTDLFLRLLDRGVVGHLRSIGASAPGR